MLDSHTSQMQTTVPDLDPEHNVTLKHAAILIMLFENWGVISEEWRVDLQVCFSKLYDAGLWISSDILHIIGLFKKNKQLMK